MPEFALVVPFDGLVEPAGVPNDLPAHVTVLFPAPAEPFVALTEAVVERFPSFPPYGGRYASIIPHLTVAAVSLDESAALVEPLLPLHSHVDSVVLYESADGRHWQEVQTFDLAA